MLISLISQILQLTLFKTVYHLFETERQKQQEKEEKHIDYEKYHLMKTHKYKHSVQ